MPAFTSRRRAAIACVALPFVWTGARAQAPMPRRATPSQTEGPFYPMAWSGDTDPDLLRNGNARYNRGQPAWVGGSVTDLQGRPVRGALVEIWQCDEAGHYHHPGDGGKADPAFQGFGRVVVDADGQYRFRTIKPAPYAGRTPHIHVKVRLGTRELLTTQLYVAGDPGNERDFLWRRLDATDRAALTQAFVAGPDGLQTSFHIVVPA